MKFTVKNIADIPELGTRQLLNVAKSLPTGKVIEVQKSELPYDKSLVLANLVKATGQKFLLHEVNGSVLFEKVSERADVKSQGFIAIRNLNPYGKFYGNAIKAYVEERGGVVVYKSAFTSISACNSFMCDLRKQGYAISGTKRGSNKVTITKEYVAKRSSSSPKADYARKLQIEDESARKFILGREAEFKGYWADPRKSNGDIASIFKCSASWVSKIARVLQLEARYSRRARFGAIQRQIREGEPVQATA